MAKYVLLSETFRDAEIPNFMIPMCQVIMLEKPKVSRFTIETLKAISGMFDTLLNKVGGES